MRVGAIADKAIHRADQFFADIAMQIMGAEDRHGRPNNGADHRRHGAIAILIASRAARAVIGDIDTIQGERRRQTSPHLIQRIIQKALINRPARRRCHDQNGHRLPRPGLIHALVETRNLRWQMADRLACQARDRLPPFQALPGEIFPHSDWREGIRLQMKPQNGDARRARLWRKHCCNILQDRRVA